VPMVSVVTIAKDNERGLRRTIESFRSQTFLDSELILVIARSSDNTHEVALEFSKIDPRIKVEVQKSIGIYSAMNEGTSRAEGKYIWYMNSGDIFFDQKSLIFGLLEIQNSDFKVIVGGYAIQEGQNTRSYNGTRKVLSPLSFSLNRRGGCHQAMIFNKQAVIESGGYGTFFSLASDFELVLKLAFYGGVLRVPTILTTIEPNGASHMNIQEVLREKQLIRQLYFKKNKIYILLGLLWTAAVKFKIIFRKCFMWLP
jgi:glycosyltransferase involved in cell wall biosynthesis